MSYESDIGNMIVINDQNAKHFIDPVVDGHKRFCALKPRDTGLYPYGGTGFAAMRTFKTYSKEELVEFIKRREETKTGLRHLIAAHGVHTKDQDGTNYCWIYSCVLAMEIAYAVQGNDFIELSATAAGTMITGGVNRGGYGAEGIDFLSKKGAPRQSLWPEWKQSTRLWTPEIEADAANNRITDWGELKYADLDQAAACLINNHPIAIGLPWWRHEVVLVDLVLLAGNVIGFVFMNPWGQSWGDNGFGVLTPDKAQGDMFFPISTLPRKKAA